MRHAVQVILFHSNDLLVECVECLIASARATHPSLGDRPSAAARLIACYVAGDPPAAGLPVAAAGGEGAAGDAAAAGAGCAGGGVAAPPAGEGGAPLPGLSGGGGALEPTAGAAPPVAALAALGSRCCSCSRY